MIMHKPVQVFIARNAVSGDKIKKTSPYVMRKTTVSFFEAKET